MLDFYLQTARNEAASTTSLGLESERFVVSSVCLEGLTTHSRQAPLDRRDGRRGKPPSVGWPFSPI